MMHRCHDYSQPTDSLSKGQVPLCDKAQISDESAAFRDHGRPCCICRNWLKPKQNRLFFLSPPTPPTTKSSFVFFQSRKRHKQVARRHEWSVPRRARSFGRGEWSVLRSGDDSGAPPAGSLVNLGYFQRDGYEGAQHCLEKEEESLWTTRVSHRRAAGMGFYSKHLDLVLICRSGHLFSGPWFPLP